MSTPRGKLLLAACCTVLGAVAHAQPQKMLDKAALHEFARASLDLQQAVDELRRQMAPAQRQLFDQSQRYWIKYRASVCRFGASGASGSAQSVVETTCRTEMTRERLAALRRLAECQRGEADCPLRR
jgi:uncharacterized protein YecT (DUF1311 family)